MNLNAISYKQLQYIFILFEMHETRNVLYQIKKQTTKRSSPLYQPDPQRDDLRNQLALLRTKLRNKDTQLLRMQAHIDELKRKITIFQTNSKLSLQTQAEKQEGEMQAFSDVPMIFENRELKQQNQSLHRQNLELNGRNNTLQAQLRAIRSDLQRERTRLKQLQILQKMREERFKDEVARLTPIIVQQNKDFSYLKEGVIKVASYLREQTFTIAFDLFLRCAKECEKEKKVSSLTIFRNCWQQLKAAKGLGYQSAVRSYNAMKKLAQTLQQQFCCINESTPRDTLNQWVLNTLVQIRHSGAKQKQQRLFRLLGLYYRSKFPIKGEKFELDEDVRAYFQDLVCHQAGLQIQ